jgi:hypothetical protein
MNYKDPKFLELANKFKALYDQMDDIFTELNKTFPPKKDQEWGFNGNGNLVLDYNPSSESDDESDLNNL